MQTPKSYRATIMCPELERCFAATASTVREAVIQAWRAHVSASSGADASDWDPDGLCVTNQQDQLLEDLRPLPAHADGPLVVVDRDRMKCPAGFVVPVEP